MLHDMYACFLYTVVCVECDSNREISLFQSDRVSAESSAELALQIVSLTATLQPLSALTDWSADLAALALDAAFSVDSADQPLIGRLAVPLAETLADLAQLSDANQQRLRRLLGRWGSGRLPPAAEGCHLMQHRCPEGSGAQQLLDSCRLQQLRPRNQLQLLSEGDRLFGGLADPSPLETQPAYTAFLRTVLDVAAPAGLTVSPEQPLLAGWWAWHERHQLASPAFLAGYRKMLAAVDDDTVREETTSAGSASKVSAAVTGAPPLSMSPALTSGAGQSLRKSRSAGQLGEATTPVRRGLFRRVSFSDIWRPTGGDQEFFLAGGGKKSRSCRQGRRRSRSADAAFSRGRSRSSGRRWQTPPRQRTNSTLPSLGPAQDSGSGGGGDGLSLKHPALRLSRGVSVPRLSKYEHVEKLMSWFLLWRHREIRMDLVKPFSGPRIALRPSMPDVLVYIWLTDQLPLGQARGRGRGRFGRRAHGLGRAAPMQAEIAKPANVAADTSSSDDAIFGDNRGEDPMLRHHMRRGRSSAYVGRGGYVDPGGGYGGRDPRQYGRQNSATPGYGNQSGQLRVPGSR